MFEKIWKARGEEGFTLIELLIVIVILGILAAIVVFAVGGITDRGSNSACLADVATAQTAVEAFRAKNGAYPGTLAATTVAPNEFMRAPVPAHLTYTAASGAVDSPNC